MYIWLAAKLDDVLKDLRKEVLCISDDYSIRNLALTLPAHVSLRISFQVEDSDVGKVCDFVESYYRKLEPFELEFSSIENHGEVIWLGIRENGKLKSMHEYLVSELAARFNVAVHPFDGDFLYHSSLVYSEDLDKVAASFGEVSRLPYPEKTTVRSFVIGSSESGKAGEYYVSRVVLL